MVSIATQTLGLVPLSYGPIIFISTIKNEDAFTQCYIPLKNDACTLTEELAPDLHSSVVKKKNSTDPSARRRRGRPRKNPILTDDGSQTKTNTNVLEGNTRETTDELVLNRVKRERKIPVKFDPSDVNKTKATSLPASEFLLKSEVEETENLSENCKLLESDSDWTDEEITKSKVYDSDDLEAIFQISDGANKRCLTTKCLQDNSVDQVIHVDSTEKKVGDEKKVGECEYTGDETICEMNFENIITKDKEKHCSLHVQTCKRKRLDHSRTKRRVKRKQRGCGPYTCELCHIDFRLISIYTKHMLNHEIAEGKHSVTCKVCGKILSSHVNLRRHMMIHTGKPFTCEMCGKGFTGRYLLREHLTVEHNQITSTSQTPTNHQCHACKKYMSTKTALQYHQAQLHTCMKCEMKWPCRTSLREHVLQIHDQVNVTKEGRLECVFCNKTFTYRHRYLNHIAHHSDEKNFVCQKCKKGFLTRQALYCHNKQVHEKYNYRYPCSFCEKVFICNAKLVEHIRTHTGEKPFACDLCSVAFAAKATFKSHMKLVHSQASKQRRWKRSKDMPLCYKYNCPLCDMKDLRADELEGHCWNVHNATVQFSYEMPEMLQTQDTLVLDSSKNIVLSKGNTGSAPVEGSKEIVVSEGSTEIVVSDGTTEIFLSEESKEIVVTEDDANFIVTGENKSVCKGNDNVLQENDT
ncbi:uncharacterized protein [Panulirus ornatus]|uniref:uncharacterized protein n=1 Tax=Panulirus ornatus TaxID=150431 RepID=UPI003A87EE80